MSVLTKDTRCNERSELWNLSKKDVNACLFFVGCALDQ